MALDHHRLVSACGHPAGTKTCTGGECQSRDETRREDNRANRRWKPSGYAHLFPSLMPLSAVVPSLLTNRRRLLSEKTETQRPSLAKREKVPLMPDCSLESTFSIVDVFKVLALDNFFHDIISIHASVVDPRGVVLHRVLLPPETKWWQKAKVENNSKNFIYIFLIVMYVILHILTSVPGVSVKWQYGTWGSGGSLCTSSVLLTLCRCVSIKGQTPRSAASCRGVPAMCEIRQAGGAGVLGAVACRRWPQGGDRGTTSFNSPLSKRVFFLHYLPEILLCWLA